jgi:peptidoglycan/LPS O-acetylase OafA/YrhL
MAERTSSGSSAAALVLMVSGVLIALLSFQHWTSCPTTPCGGMLMAISTYTGIDLGFGIVTGVTGVLLAGIGVDALRHDGASSFAPLAVSLALLTIATIGASVVWMYVIPDDDNEYYWPPSTAILIGLIGLIAMAASLRLRKRLLLSGGQSDHR